MGHIIGCKVVCKYFGEKCMHLDVLKWMNVRSTCLSVSNKQECNSVTSQPEPWDQIYEVVAA